MIGSLPESVVRASSLMDSRGRAAEAPRRAGWRYEELVGRLVELSGLGDSACLTLAAAVVLDAQVQGETTAWVTGTDSSFYPPDLEANGVDLRALVVVRAGNVVALARSAERLVRSGAFGLVVVDLASLSGRAPRVPVALQARLRCLVREHDAAILFVTEKHREIPSLDSLVSLRIEGRRQRLGKGHEGGRGHDGGRDRGHEGGCSHDGGRQRGHGQDRFSCELEVLKDKRRGPGRKEILFCRGPGGL